MKKQIRYGVFETNSSSTHSISIGNFEDKLLNFIQKPDYEYNEDTGEFEDTTVYDGNIHVTFGEFGWQEDTYNDVYTKLIYALTMVIETEGGHYNRGKIKSIEDYYESEGFKAIEKLVRKHCHCGIVIEDSNIVFHETESGGYISHNGYIDHQSCEEYKSLKDFVDHYKISLEDFIFNTDITLVTDNDN